MANTLNGINLDAIAQKTLDFLGLMFFPLTAVTRDLSQEILTQGNSVTTRVASSVPAVSVAAGYTAQDVTSTSKQVTLDKNKGFPFALTDAEVQKSAFGYDWLRDIFMVPALESVLKAAMADLLALATAANFTTTPRTITAANFDADDVVDLQTDLDGINAPTSDRALIIKPTYRGSLVKDNPIQDAAAYGGVEAIREGRVPRVSGFSPITYNNIPANGESLEGVALHASALIIAARPQVVPNNFPGQVVNTSDPLTGLPLQFRYWYDANNKKEMLSVEALYGVAVGNGTAAVRIKSA